MEREVVETRGGYRAVIIRDEYPDAPDYDMQAAVMSFDGSRWETYVKCQTDAAQTFEDAAKRFVQTFGMSDGITILERYARIFHGTRDFRRFSYSYVPDSCEYVAFDSAAIRAEWGYDGDDAAKGDAEAWQAYIDGEVYGITIEQCVSVFESRVTPDGSETKLSREEWEEVEYSTMWGYYGQDYASSEALALLDAYTPKGGDSK